MIPEAWSSPLTDFFWQTAVHSAIAGFILYAWARQRELPSGRAKRHLLAVLLVLPLLTAAVPGRGGLEFRDHVAWLDSGRLRAIPLVAGFRVGDAAAVLALVMVALTVWQEIVPVLLRRRASAEPAPAALARRARDLPGWSRCEVALSDTDDILLATGGWPWRPRLVVSRGALSRLRDDELAMVLRHEHAHWRDGRWIRAHAFFLVRMLQCYHPVALWSFREYCLEVEIECDAAAVAGRDPRPMVRALLAVYDGTDRRDIAARAALRRRADVLLGARPRDDNALPSGTILVVSAFLLVILPWIV